MADLPASYDDWRTRGPNEDDSKHFTDCPEHEDHPGVCENAFDGDEDIDGCGCRECDCKAREADARAEAAQAKLDASKEAKC